MHIQKSQKPAEYAKIAAFIFILLLIAAAVIAFVRAYSLSRVEEEKEQQGQHVEQEAAQSLSHEGSGASTTEEGLIYVHVDGAVLHPGVYQIHDAKPRIQNAVAAAGGLLSEADTSQINLASELKDGEKIHVPLKGEVLTQAPSNLSGQGASQNQLVNINTASKEELMTLSGIGESTAQAIIDERNSSGAFANIDELLRVSGLGERKLARIRTKICV